MATQVQFRRGNTVQHSTFAGAIAELTIDTDNKTVVVHDGVTLGGHPLASIGNIILSSAASNNWANTKVDTIASNSNSRVWANSVVSSGIETVFLDLASSGVTAGGYGSATNIPVFNVDAYGRVTYASNVAVQGMDYAYVNTAATAGNNYALGTATGIGAAGNNYAISIGASANNWANTKLANTSGITFNGDLNVSGNLSAEGTSFFVNGVTNNVGIGRSDAGYSLDVVGTVNAALLLVNGAPVGGGGLTVGIQNTSSATFYPLFTSNTSGSIATANVDSTDLYFVPSTGTLSAKIFNSLSDRNLKDNVETFDGRNLIKLISPVTFIWKDNGNKSYGVIAQELEKVLPELVETNEQGVKSVSYIPLIAILLDVIQKQGEEIKEIKQRLNMEK